MICEGDPVSLHVVERGSHHGGAVCVLLHYFGGSSRAWTGVMNSLADHYRCCALDLPGFGASRPLVGDVSVDDMATAVAITLAKLRIDSYTLIGHSMGAKIAWALAARRSIGFKSLVLLAPSPPIAEPMADSERARLLHGFGCRETAEATTRNIVARRLSGADHEGVIEDSLRTSHEAWEWWLQRGSRENIAHSTSEIDAPTLVVAGQFDQPLSPQYVEETVARKIQGAQMRVVPGARHLLPIEAPAETAALITAHCAVLQGR